MSEEQSNATSTPPPTPSTTATPSTTGETPPKQFSKILKVKADPPDLPDEERKKKVKALAGAIAHGMRQFGEVHLRCFGDHAIAKAAKAATIASSYLAAHAYDLYLRPYYIKTEMDSKERTGLCFLCVSSQSGDSSVLPKAPDAPQAPAAP